MAAGTSVDVLMERAGAALAEAIWRFGNGRPVLILCGPGNNGGDGYVAARLLSERGLSVSIAAVGQPRTEVAARARAGYTGAVVALEDAVAHPVLVDSLFGTGLSRPLDEPLARHLQRLAEAADFVIAVDLPSGLNTDSGALLGGVQADLTVALGALKPVHLLQPGAGRCGTILCADIGVRAASDVHALGRPRLAVPAASAHKYSRGFVGIIGGAMAGASLLAARAAMPLAGYVALSHAKRIGPDALVHRRWDDLASDARVGALLIGPGLGRDDKARTKLEAVLETSHALVLDADALVLLSAPDRLLRRGGRSILTPHGGEFDTVFGKSDASKIERTRAAARASGAAVIFKGSDSVIAAPDGRVAVAPPAPGWLASAGTGDVLAGIASAMLASGMDSFEAACAAVWLHADTARRAGPGLMADDLPRHVPAALASCL